MKSHFNDEQLKELETNYRIARQEAEKTYDLYIADLIVKLIEDMNELKRTINK